MLSVALRVQDELSRGTVCNSNDLENTIDLYLINIYIAFAFAGLTLLRVVALTSEMASIDEAKKLCWTIN